MVLAADELPDDTRSLQAEARVARGGPPARRHCLEPDAGHERLQEYRRGALTPTRVC